MRNEALKDRFVRIAMNLFIARGFHQITVSDLLKEVGSSESTFRRYFTHGLPTVYKTSLTMAVNMVANAYREMVNEGCSLEEVATQYLSAVLKLYFGQEFDRQNVILLFGAEGRLAAKHRLPQEYHEDAIWSDVNALTSHLETAGASKRQAQHIKHLVLGSLSSFISSGQSDETDGEALVAMLQSALTQLSSRRIQSDVPKARLLRIAEEAEHLASNIRKLAS